MCKIKEEWRAIKGYEGLYEVSDWGNVRSVDNEIVYLVKGKYPAKRIVKGKLLKTYKNNGGYVMVGLNNNSKKNKRTIHRLVAEAFIPNPEKKPTVNHKNHDRTDNRVENLEWATYPEQNDEIMRKKLSKATKGKSKPKVSEALKGKFAGEKNPNYGKHLSDETKNKISDANSKQVFQYTLEGELVGVFKNSVIASKETGFPQAQINKYCHGKYYSKKYGKWYFKNIYKGYRWSFEPL